MAKTFYFYDLETSGINPRDARVMQFAGQRVSMDMEPIGEPHNFLIRLSDDVLPEPEAILITGITPQQTLADGISEAEFLHFFMNEIATPETIFTGFNSIRFDDEFMRFMLYRNFYDPFEWQWKDGRSRWDILDVVRMTRALRPEGINWPVDSKGAASNKLEYLTKLNKLDHSHAHDALNDVLATIAVARLIKNKQPKLFNFLLGMRDKKRLAALVSDSQPFVYTSGKYPAEYEKTTVVVKLADHPKKQGILVYDLRIDPTPFLKMTSQQLADAWKWVKDATEPRLPVKTMQFNRCPAAAPLSVLNETSWQRIKLSSSQITQNYNTLKTDSVFIKRIQEALAILDDAQQLHFINDDATVDSQLYDAFLPDEDRINMSLVRAAGAEELSGLSPNFVDARLTNLLPLYKARNYPRSLSDEERIQWERYREQKLLGGKQTSRMARYFQQLQELANRPALTQKQSYIIEELQLYGQSILPAELESD